MSYRYGAAAALTPGASKRTRPLEPGSGSGAGGSAEDLVDAIIESSDINASSDAELSGKAAKRSRANRRDSAEGGEQGGAQKTKAVAATALPAFSSERPAARMADMAGIDSIVSVVKELVFYPVSLVHLLVKLIYRSNIMNIFIYLIKL
jgi:hypothetical protein